MHNIKSIEETLVNQIPAQLHPQIKTLIALLESSVNNEETTSLGKTVLVQDPSLNELLQFLKDKSFAVGSAVVAFGANNNLGDVKLRDVAGRDIVSLNINLTNNSLSHTTCSRCAYINGSDFCLCVKCGESLVKTCVECGSESVYTFSNICIRCGIYQEDAILRRNLERELRFAKSQYETFNRDPEEIQAWIQLGNTEIRRLQDIENNQLYTAKYLIPLGVFLILPLVSIMVLRLIQNVIFGVDLPDSLVLVAGLLNSNALSGVLLLVAVIGGCCAMIGISAWTQVRLKPQQKLIKLEREKIDDFLKRVEIQQKMAEDSRRKMLLLQKELEALSQKKSGRSSS